MFGLGRGTEDVRVAIVREREGGRDGVRLTNEILQNRRKCVCVCVCGVPVSRVRNTHVCGRKPVLVTSFQGA